MCAILLPELTSFVAATLFAVHPIHTEAVSIKIQNNNLQKNNPKKSKEDSRSNKSKFFAVFHKNTFSNVQLKLPFPSLPNKY
jgi:hypothetical protein